MIIKKDVGVLSKVEHILDMIFIYSIKKKRIIQKKINRKIYKYDEGQNEF